MIERTVFLGADHGGYALKEALRVWLSEQPQLAESVIDDGAFDLDPSDDYVTFGAAVARDVSLELLPPEEEPTTFGVLACRSGGGMCIVANRFAGVRAVVCRNEDDVNHARRHNNANILVLEGDHISQEEAQKLTKLFLETPFDAGRHIERVQAIEELRS